MADRMRDRAPDGPGGERPDTEPPHRVPEDGAGQTPAARAGTEHRKAETETAAGDVADDLADFA